MLHKNKETQIHFEVNVYPELSLQVFMSYSIVLIRSTNMLGMVVVGEGRVYLIWTNPRVGKGEDNDFFFFLFWVLLLGQFGFEHTNH